MDNKGTSDSDANLNYSELSWISMVNVLIDYVLNLALCAGWIVRIL